MGPTWGPPGSCRPQMGPMLAPRTLLSGHAVQITYIFDFALYTEFSFALHSNLPNGIFVLSKHFWAALQYRLLRFSDGALVYSSPTLITSQATNGVIRPPIVWPDGVWTSLVRNKHVTDTLCADTNNRMLGNNEDFWSHTSVQWLKFAIILILNIH